MNNLVKNGSPQVSSRWNKALLRRPLINPSALFLLFGPGTGKPNVRLILADDQAYGNIVDWDYKIYLDGMVSKIMRRYSSKADTWHKTKH